MAEVKYGRGYVYSIQYHLVWYVKYRHKVLVDNIEGRLKELLHQIAEDNGFTIVEMESDLDHIHLLVDCTPQHSIPTMMKALKGVSARLLFKEFPELKRKLWEPFLFCCNGQRANGSTDSGIHSKTESGVSLIVGA